MHENRKAYEKEEALRQRKATLEAKRLERLERATQRKKMLSDLRHDDTAVKYREQQRRRQMKRDEDYLHPNPNPQPNPKPSSHPNPKPNP